MKKTFLILTTISVFLGLGYLILGYTTFGKKLLIKWLIKRWRKDAEKDPEEEFVEDHYKLALNNKKPFEVFELFQYQLLDSIRRWHTNKSFRYYHKQKKLWEKISKRDNKLPIDGIELLKEEQLN